MKCPGCGRDGQEGKFCSECGTVLGGACPECGSELLPGARFCTQCGQPVAVTRKPGPGGARWPLILGAAALLVVVLIFMLPRQADRAGAPEVARPATGAIPADPGARVSADGLLSGDMRTNADRLFNRVMGAAQRGDQAEVTRFMPMAIQAYGLVEDLDDDGILHLAMLHLTAGDPARAEATASRVLEDSPDHILALGVAAAAARQAGDEAGARALYRRLLDAYPEEAVKPLPEYVDHQAMLPEYRRIAREAVGEADGEADGADR